MALLSTNAVQCGVQYYSRGHRTNVIYYKQKHVQAFIVSPHMANVTIVQFKITVARLTTVKLQLWLLQS